MNVAVSLPFTKPFSAYVRRRRNYVSGLVIRATVAVAGVMVVVSRAACIKMYWLVHRPENNLNVR